MNLIKTIYRLGHSYLFLTEYQLLIGYLMPTFDSLAILTINLYLCLETDNRIRTVYSRGLNKGVSSRFCEHSRFRYETPEEGQSTYRPKHC